jgi:hypothetical protein
MGDAAGMRLLQVGFILEQELVLPERMVQPGRLEAAEIHPEDQILRFNFFNISRTSFRRTGERVGVALLAAGDGAPRVRGQDCLSLMISYA